MDIRGSFVAVLVLYRELLQMLCASFHRHRGCNVICPRLAIGCSTREGMLIGRYNKRRGVSFSVFEL